MLLGRPLRPQQRFQTSDALAIHITPFCYTFAHKHTVVDCLAE